MFFLLNVTGFSELVDYWKSLVLDNYWAKHFFILHIAPIFHTAKSWVHQGEKRSDIVLNVQGSIALSLKIQADDDM